MEIKKRDVHGKYKIYLYICYGICEYFLNLDFYYHTTTKIEFEYSILSLFMHYVYSHGFFYVQIFYKFINFRAV